MKKISAFIIVFISMLQQTEASDVKSLYVAINERLSYMEDVAVYKAKNNLPIEDLRREAIVLEKAKSAAQKQGIDPNKIELFFKAQISVAKAIQFRHRANLLFEKKLPEARDLKIIVRPALIRHGNNIISKIAEILKKKSTLQFIEYEGFDRALNQKYVTKREKELLFESLVEIKK